MFKYYVDIEIDLKNIKIVNKNKVGDYLFSIIHGILRSKPYSVGLSFPKFSASKGDKFKTLGRIFRLVSNNIDDLNEIVGRNSLDNLSTVGVIKIHPMKKVPEDFVSFYVFKRHHPRFEVDEKGVPTNVYGDRSFDECVPVNIIHDNQNFIMFIKKVKVKNGNTNKLFSTYGLGNFDGPEVPVF